MTFWKGYFTGDIHGSDLAFKKLLKAGKFYDTQAVILAGDLVGKGITPIVKTGIQYQCEIAGETRIAETSEELNQLAALVNNSGFYAYVTTPDEVAALKSDPKKTEDLVNRLISERIESWVSQMEDASKRDGTIFYASPGNDDPMCVDEILNASHIIINPEEKCMAVHEKIDILTCGWTNPTPWDTQRELPEDKLLEKLEGLVNLVPDPKKCIFSLHAPPANTKLDVAPSLDKNFRMKSGLGGVPFQNVGSTAVRTIIEKYQPLVGMHGHIHECAGKDKIGNTLIFNHGSEYGQGMLRGIILIFNVDKQAKYVNYLSVSG